MEETKAAILLIVCEVKRFSLTWNRNRVLVCGNVWAADIRCLCALAASVAGLIATAFRSAEADFEA